MVLGEEQGKAARPYPPCVWVDNVETGGHKDQGHVIRTGCHITYKIGPFWGNYTTWSVSSLAHTMGWVI